MSFLDPGLLDWKDPMKVALSIGHFISILVNTFLKTAYMIYLTFYMKLLTQS